VVPLDERGALFEEIFALFNSYQADRDPASVLTRDEFIASICTSPLGSLSTEAAAQLTQQAPATQADAGKRADTCPPENSPVGSCFSLLCWQGRVIACVLLDLVAGSGSQTSPIMGTKSMWFDANDASRGEGAYSRSIVELVWYKHLVFAGQLGYEHLWNGYSDPKQTRLVYKLERFWQHSEAQCEKGWVPLAECMDRDSDGAFCWNHLHSNLTKRSGERVEAKVQRSYGATPMTSQCNMSSHIFSCPLLVDLKFVGAVRPGVEHQDIGTDVVKPSKTKSGTSSSRASSSETCGSGPCSSITTTSSFG
jgi:hypothetical protein